MSEWDEREMTEDEERDWRADRCRELEEYSDALMEQRAAEQKHKMKVLVIDKPWAIQPKDNEEEKDEGKKD